MSAQSPVRVVRARTAAQWAAAVAIRLAVFVDEQRVPVDAEIDRWDVEAVHIIATLPHSIAAHKAAPLAPARCGTAAQVVEIARRFYPHGVRGALTTRPDHLPAAVGVGRLFREDDISGRVGRLAVLPAFRRQSIGSRLLSRLEREAGLLGLSRIVLHAQAHAIPFYQQQGYVADRLDDVFQEDGIPHVAMRKHVAL